MFREDVKLFPYRIKKQKTLREADKERRVGLCSDFNVFLEDNPAVPRSIWFSDELHFNRVGYVNKQNMCVWTSEHPHNVMETRLHPEKWTALCALSTNFILDHFIDDALTADRYLHVLQDFLPCH
jgi:hypothetical protein